MVKITYDLDNLEESEIVEDYYFFKYYIKSLNFDWAKFYDEMRSYENGKNKDEITQIIMNHLNKYEFQRFLKITKRFMFDNSINCVMHKVLTDGNNLIYRYKYFLRVKFPEIQK